MVCRAGKNTKKTAPPAETRLETTAVVHRAATPEPEEEHKATSHQPVSVQLQSVTEDC